MTLDDSAGPSCAEPVHTCSTSESSDVFRLLSASAAFLAIPGVALSLPHSKASQREDGNAEKCSTRTNSCGKRSHGPCQAMSISMVESLAPQNLIGIRWHGLATIWKWREITPSAFLLHVILVHIRFIFIVVFWHDSARAFDLFPRSSSILRRSVQDFAVITLWELQ